MTSPLNTYSIWPFNEWLTLEIKLIKWFSYKHKANLLIEIQMTETQASRLLVLCSQKMCLSFIISFGVFYFNLDYTLSFLQLREDFSFTYPFMLASLTWSVT